MKPEQLSHYSLLEGLVEEAGELVQAAAKVLRIERGENATPVAMREAMDNLHEEIADVSLVATMLYRKGFLDSKKVDDICNQKYIRWEGRLNAGKN